MSQALTMMSAFSAGWKLVVVIAWAVCRASSTSSSRANLWPVQWNLISRNAVNMVSLGSNGDARMIACRYTEGGSAKVLTGVCGGCWLR